MYFSPEILLSKCVYRLLQMEVVQSLSLVVQSPSLELVQFPSLLVLMLELVHHPYLSTFHQMVLVLVLVPVPVLVHWSELVYHHVSSVLLVPP
jgi:hypothetical protein